MHGCRTGSCFYLKHRWGSQKKSRYLNWNRPFPSQPNDREKKSWSGQNKGLFMHAQLTADIAKYFLPLFFPDSQLVEETKCLP